MSIDSAADLSPDQEAFLWAAWSQLITKGNEYFYFSKASKPANLSFERNEQVVDELIAADVLRDKLDDARARLTDKGQTICRELTPIREARQEAKRTKRDHSMMIKGAGVTLVVELILALQSARWRTRRWRLQPRTETSQTRQTARRARLTARRAARRPVRPRASAAPAGTAAS